MEGEACLAGLLIAIHQGWNVCVIESDCALLITALHGLGADFSELGCIVEDCREYMKVVHPIQVKHVFRETNGVAYRLAHVASWSNIDEF